MKIPVVIPEYKSDKETLNKIKNMLKNQTVKTELIEIKNLPETIAFNTGIKKSKGAIVIVLCQDTIPDNKNWIKKIIAPFKDKNVMVSVPDTYLPYDFWKKYDIFTRALTIKEQKIIRSPLDARGCAYRKELFKKIGYFTENTKLIGMDEDLYMRVVKNGKIAHPGCKILHLHKSDFLSRLKMEYKHSRGGGGIIRKYMFKYPDWKKKIIRALPIVGIVPLLFVFPVKRAPLLFLIYLLLSPILNMIYTLGFWKGFIEYKKE